MIILQLESEQLSNLIKSSVRTVLAEDQTPKPPHDERLTRQELCSLYKISLPTVHKHMKEGLPYEKLGRKTLFRRQEIDYYFRNKTACHEK